MNALEKMKSTLTTEEAITLAKSNWWEGLDPKEVALAQLQQKKLCMPFAEFQTIVGKVLGRGVFTHEFVEPKTLIHQIQTGAQPTETPLESLDRLVSGTR